MGNMTTPGETPAQFDNANDMHELLHAWFHSWIATKEYKELEPAALQQHAALKEWLHRCIAGCNFVE